MEGASAQGLDRGRASAQGWSVGRAIGGPVLCVLCPFGTQGLEHDAAAARLQQRAAAAAAERERLQQDVAKLQVGLRAWAWHGGLGGAARWARGARGRLFCFSVRHCVEP